MTLTSTEPFSMERGDSVQSLGAENARTALPSSHHHTGRQQQQQQLSSSPMGRSGLYRNAMLAASDSQRSLSSSTRSSPKVSAEEQIERCRQETQGTAEELRRNLYRNAMLAASDSQRSLKSAESNRSCSLSIIEVEEERHRQELETQRVAEEAQEEELMRLALERSLTETSGSFNFSPTESPVRHQSAPARPAPAFTGSSSRGVENTVSPPTQPHLMCEAEQRQQVSADEDNDDDDDDISSMFDLSPCEPVSSAHAVRMQPTCLPPAPSLQQKNSRPGVTAPPSGPPAQPTSTQESPLQLHLSSSRATSAQPADDRNVTATAAGAVSVSSPAPKRKSPRARTVESLQSPSIDDTTKPIVKGGSAINVDGAVITKSPEVRTAIVKHVTSPPVSQSSSKKSCNLIPPSSDGENSVDGNNDGQQQTGTEQSVPQQLAESNVWTTDSKVNSGRAERCCSRAAGDDECKRTLPDKKATAQSPWKNSKMQEERKAVSSADWPALGEQQPIPKKKEGAKYAKFRQYVDSFQSEEERFDLSGANISSEELQEIERALRESQLCEDSSAGGIQPNATAAASSVAAQYDFDGAEEHLSEEELRKIQEALLEETTPERAVGGGRDELEDSKPAAVVVDGLSEEDAAAIVQALREAEEEEEAMASRMRETSEEEERRSFELALKIQKEEERLQYTVPGGSREGLQNQGKVRTVTRAELLEYANLGSANDTSYPVDGFDDVEEDHLLAAGFRMNSSARQQWTRRDQNSIVGPNREVRTKHDTALHGQANAHRLGLEVDEIAEVGNKAYNSFMQSIKGAKKGVAKAGTGRAGSDTDSTKGGAMDPNVRSVISRAINNEIIEKCNGVVKEGKEAVVYHADQGTDSEGFDVAVKVFKRIQEFRGRGEYVDGDPRYGKTTFKNVSNREQLELWTEKEFRNLMRANKAGVPVPSPLFYKENVLFMRFLGSDGWPAPQLRELDLRRGSKRWTTLYIQVLDAMKR